METSIFDSFIRSVIKSRFKQPASYRKDQRNSMKFNIEEINKLLLTAEDVFKLDPLLLKLPADIIVVGDLHGNIDDLLRIFTRCGYPPETKYIFLGDYVDRGQNSIEVFLLLVALKVRHPDCIYMLRGNHESESMTSVYGFRAEVRRRLNKQIFGNFIRVFKYLPIAAVIDNKVFCVHGGISKDLHKVDQLLKMKKPDQIPQEGIIADLLWSDPTSEVENFQLSDRNVGYLFGAKPLCKFLDQNGLELLVRSHESCDRGFSWPFENAGRGQRSLLTIFSSTDYCDESNDAAVLRVPKDGDYEIITFARGKRVRFTLPSFLIHNQLQEKPAVESDEDQVNAIPNTQLFPLLA
jgi:serine/threonine-protein phosphatase PP1 catalytic subunit